MRILFVMRHAGYVRNFEWVLRLLADRGHRVHLAFERDRPEFPLAVRLAAETDGAITWDLAPGRDDRWRALAYGVRQSASYLRYLSPEFHRANKLRRRWGRRTPRVAVWLAGLPGLRSEPVRRSALSALQAVERRIPRPGAIEEHVRSGSYDLVLLTPLVDGPTQHDWLRAAKRLGVPGVLAVASWDNLTNKGLTFDVPDRTYVWNGIQEREAIDLHRLPADTVAVVGAHTFDHWFDWKPSTTREEFCARIGLDPSRPFILYVASSGFISRDESAVVARWLEVLRRDGELARVGVLVRPHPMKGEIWEDSPIAGLDDVAVWPAAGAYPSDDEQRAGLYDSIHHAAAVVGANTSALIDAAIVGRRTYTVLLPELRGAQEDTLHFHYLLPEHGGALTVAHSLEEHVAQLRDVVLSSPEGDEWRRRFLETFIRPHGLDWPAAPRFVDDLERLGGRRETRAVSTGNL